MKNKKSIPKITLFEGSVIYNVQFENGPFEIVAQTKNCVFNNNTFIGSKPFKPTKKKEKLK